MIFNFNRNKNRLAIQTVFLAKENILFLKEWLLYHQHLGVVKFYLYDNSGVQFGDDNEPIVSNIKIFKAGKISKYGVDYDSLINLTEKDVQKLLSEIINSFDGDVELIKWQPKDSTGRIVYGHRKSMLHFKKNYGRYNDWVAFIDMDEYIFSPNNLNLMEYLRDCDNNKIRCIKIFQKIFECRYSYLEKNVIEINRCIENIDTTNNYKKGSWGEKNIIKIKYLKDLRNIHDMKLKRGKLVEMNPGELRFNHYNLK